MGRTLRGFLSRRKTQDPRETTAESRPSGENPTEWITVGSSLPLNEKTPTEPEAFEASGCATALRSLCAMKLVEEGCSRKSIRLGEPVLRDGAWTIEGAGERKKDRGHRS